MITLQSGMVNGFYLSSGTLKYLTEFSYTRTNIEYTSGSIDDLSQDEITFIHHRYFLNKSFKYGIHTNSTSYVDLQNGNTLILGGSYWKFFGYDKLTLGKDFYYSIYGINLPKQLVNIAENKPITPQLDYEASKLFIRFTDFSDFSTLISKKEL